LGRLFAALRQRHLDQNTLVVITGDHGEAFGFPHPWFFHGTNLYQEGVNVPCILWSPALFTPGSRSETVGAHVDLNPTIMDILGIATPSAWQGRSLLDPDRPQRAYFNCNTGYLLEGMREGDWKFIYNMTLAREELYDLASDPTEQHNLASQNPRLCAIYRQRLASWATYERGHLDALAK
jgi:arylsulfatase A-like enzyme